MGELDQRYEEKSYVLGKVAWILFSVDCLVARLLNVPGLVGS